MNQIPNYVRLTTNRYKGSITEKVASHHLKKEGFKCEKFIIFKIQLGTIRYEQTKIGKLTNAFLKDAQKTMKENKQYWERILEKYSSESPPKGWHDPRGRTWAMVRKDEIKMARNQIKAVEEYFKKQLQFLDVWGTHFQPIVKYFKLLEEVNYTPDFIAKKGNKVFILEVKSETKQGMAPLGKHQKKGLLKAYDYGFRPMLLIVPIDISIEIGEPKITVVKS
jgi:hypothetical protein